MSFSCQRCGRCCKDIGIPWSELDPRQVADYLNMEIGEFLDLYGFIVNEYSAEIEHTELSATPCPFLKYQKKRAVCKIYPVRPWICKGYPGPGISCSAGRKGLHWT